MWISTAIASEVTNFEADPPSMGEAFLYNAGFILLVVLMFYFIFIRPQQKRMDEHANMLNALKIGDDIVTGGGLVGKVSKLIDDREVEIELGDGIKVVALRSTLLEKPVLRNKSKKATKEDLKAELGEKTDTEDKKSENKKKDSKKKDNKKG